MLAGFFSVSSGSLSKKPNKKYNFVQNYLSHIKYNLHYVRSVGQKLINDDDFDLNKDILSKIRIGDPLYDMHDYIDEIAGVSVLPVASVILSMTLLVNAAVEGIKSLMSKDVISKTKHNDEAKISAVMGGLLFLYAIGNTIKSLISLVSRPIITAIKGFDKNPKEDRFSDIGKDSPSF